MTEVFLHTGDLPWRLSVEKLPLGGLWFSSPPDFSRPRIGVVGTRTPDNAALEFAERLGRQLAGEGIDVVSGGAAGIDGAAHRGCLSARTRAKTWLVSPVGLDEVYPSVHRKLFDQVREQGFVVSHYARNRTYLPGMAKPRNGVIAAFVDALVLVQGKSGSGTHDAADRALKRSVPVLLMSGPAWDVRFGANRDNAHRPGARWMHSETELWSAIRLATAAPDPAQRNTPELTHTTRTLLELLGPEPRHLDWVAQQSGLPMAELAPVLLTLSLEDVVREGPAGFWAIGSRSPGNYV